MLRRLVGMDTVHALISRFLRTRFPLAGMSENTNEEKNNGSNITVRVVHAKRVGQWGEAKVHNYFLTS